MHDFVVAITNYGGRKEGCYSVGYFLILIKKISHYLGCAAAHDVNAEWTVAN